MSDSTEQVTGVIRSSDGGVMVTTAPTSSYSTISSGMISESPSLSETFSEEYDPKESEASSREVEGFEVTRLSNESAAAIPQQSLANTGVVYTEDGFPMPSVGSGVFPINEHSTGLEDAQEQPMSGMSVIRNVLDSDAFEKAREDTQRHCLPQGLTLQATPMFLCMGALILTFTGSWSCFYFRGADIGFTGGHYGIWTLEDSFGKCQLWDILFYSYHLDPHLSAARSLSMSAMVIGLANLVTMLQAQQIHVVSWGVGWGFGLLFVVSVSTSSIFNVWIVWWWFSYIIMTLFVRALLVHPVVRRISKRGARIISFLFFYCAVSTLLTLVILRSDYCRCVSLTTERLEREIDPESCTGSCKLESSGYTIIFASAGWLATAGATYILGVQPKNLKDDPSKYRLQYAHYSRDSITTRAVHAAESVGHVVENVVHTAADVGRMVIHLSNHSDSKHSKSMDERSSTTRSGSLEDECAPPRTTIQKVCCDYRVTERTWGESWRFWIFRITLGFIFFIYMFLTALLLGSRVENARAERAPSTDPNFITDVVCGFLPNEPTAPFQTFETKEEATDAGYLVAHCGACGFCSNLPDIETYVKTRKTIAQSSKKCGPKVFLASYGDLVECLEERINFSRECTVCWADNMITTGEECFFTCVDSLFTGFLSNNNVPGAGDQGWLNHCLQCDERLSGTQFVTCSGVARRRLGIVSEIERNPSHQCRNTDVDWLEYFGVD